MNLRQYLVSRNKRQVEFAREAGLSKACVSKLCRPEKYRNRVSVDVIRKVYEASGGAVTADDLLGLSLASISHNVQAAE